MSAHAMPALTPMTAHRDRILDRKQAQHEPVPDMAELSESLHRDLLRRIKVDSERGA